MFTEARLPDGTVLEYADLGSPTGVPVFHHHGSPGTAGVGALADEAARRHGVRLIAVSRPGYGASTPTPPGLASVARQVVTLADSLGIDRFGTLGLSGGGPFALATAVVAPERVTGVVVAGGLAPGLAERIDDEDIALLATGDVQAAEAQMTAGVEQMIAGMRGQSEEEFREGMSARRPPGETYFDDRPDEQTTFLADFRRALATPSGFVRDNMSWGGDWDVEVGRITCPVTLVYGEVDQMAPVVNGHLLAELLPHARLTIVPGGGHGDATFGSGDLVMGVLADGARLTDA